MSIRPDDFLIYVCELLNIKTESKFTLAEMISDIKAIHPIDLPKFKDYLKVNFNDSSYEFMNGPQKFNAIMKDFNYWNRPRLSEKAKIKVENYATYLFKKTAKVFDHINWELESKGRSIDEVNLKKIHAAGKPLFSESDLEYLKQVGTIEYIYNLNKRSKTKLESEILKAVTVYTLIKHDPRNQLENKQKSTMEMLKEKVS